MIDTVGMNIPLRRQDVKKLFARPDSAKDKLLLQYKWKRATSALSGRSCLVFPCKTGNEIHVEMSLAKWVQGHNIYGINNMQRLCFEGAKEIYRSFVIELTDPVLNKLRNHNYKLGRCDITGSFNVGSQSNVVAIMAEIRLQLLAQEYNLVPYENLNGVETIYVGKSKRVAKIKFYNKYLELMANPLPTDLPGRDIILKNAKNLIRFEVTLRSTDLENKGLRWSQNWSTQTVQDLLLDAFNKFLFTGEVKARLDAKQIAALKPRHKMLYGFWHEGANMMKHMPLHTYRRSRKELLQFNIDIGRPSQNGNGTMSLAKMLSPERMSITWPKSLTTTGVIYGSSGWKQTG